MGRKKPVYFIEGHFLPPAIETVYTDFYIFELRMDDTSNIRSSIWLAYVCEMGFFMQKCKQCTSLIQSL